MNSKEKQELKKELLHSNLSNKTIVKIVKCLEALEHPQPLDAGEWLKEKGLKESIIKFIDGDPDDPEEFYLGDLLKEYAQDSITAKQREMNNEIPRLYKKGNYPFTIKHCPGYAGYTPDDLDHEVCKWCGNIEYYH